MQDGGGLLSSFRANPGRNSVGSEEVRLTPRAERPVDGEKSDYSPGIK